MQVVDKVAAPAERRSQPAARAQSADRLSGATLPLLCLLGCLLITTVVFFRLDAIGAWEWQIIDNAKLVQTTGRINLSPFPVPETLAQKATEARASEVAYNIITADLATFGGVDAAGILRLPIGVGLYVLGGLFFIRSLSRAIRLDLPIAFVLVTIVTAMSLFYAYFLWGVYETSIGWFLLLVSWGLLIRFKCSLAPSITASLYVAAWAAITIALNYVYPTAMLVNVAVSGVIFAYTSGRTLLARAPHLSRSPTGPPAPTYFVVAAIVFAVFTLHPFFDHASLGLAAQWRSVLTTLAEFLHRSESSQYGSLASLSPLTDRLLILEFLVLFLIVLLARAAIYWRSRREAQRSGAMLLEAIVLGAALMPVLALAWGNSRSTEAIYVLFPVAACVVAAPQLRGPLRAALAGLLLITSIAPGIAFAFDRSGVVYDQVTPGESRAATWAAGHINTPYFTDLRMVNLVLLDNPDNLADAPYVTATDQSDVAPYYRSGDAFASKLRQQGYTLAAFRAPDFTIAVSLSEYPVPPLNRRTIETSPRFAAIYDDGDVQVYTVAPAPGGP